MLGFEIAINLDNNNYIWMRLNQEHPHKTDILNCKCTFENLKLFFTFPFKERKCENFNL